MIPYKKDVFFSSRVINFQIDIQIYGVYLFVNKGIFLHEYCKVTKKKRTLTKVAHCDFTKNWCFKKTIFLFLFKVYSVNTHTFITHTREQPIRTNFFFRHKFAITSVSFSQDIKKWRKYFLFHQNKNVQITNDVIIGKPKKDVYFECNL